MFTLYKNQLNKVPNRKQLDFEVFIHQSTIDKLNKTQKEFINHLIHFSKLYDSDIIKMKNENFDLFKIWCEYQKKWLHLLKTTPYAKTDGRFNVGEYEFNDFLIFNVRPQKRLKNQFIELTLKQI